MTGIIPILKFAPSTIAEDEIPIVIPTAKHYMLATTELPQMAVASGDTLSQYTQMNLPCTEQPTLTATPADFVEESLTNQESQKESLLLSAGQKVISEGCQTGAGISKRSYRRAKFQSAANRHRSAGFYDIHSKSQILPTSDMRKTMHFYCQDLITVISALETPMNLPANHEAAARELKELTIPALKSKRVLNKRMNVLDSHLAKAESGDPESQYELGEAYLNGQISKNETEALRWLIAASDGGNTAAQYRIGRFYFKAQDYVSSLASFNLASGKSEKARYYIGCCHYGGLGPLLKDYAEAIRWFRSSSGYKKSQTSLGLCYYFGHAVSLDYAVALQWFNMAASKRCVEAQYQLGCMYRKGHGVISDDVRAFEYFQLASKYNHLHAKYSMAIAYHQGRGVTANVKYATKLYLEAAESGNPEAQNIIGYFFETGRGVQQDYELAARFYRKSSVQGNSQAQSNLASLYQRGLGVERDDTEAMRLYRLAAENGTGNSDAMYHIGLCYQTGTGVFVNRTRAAEWFEKSAKLANDKGQFALAKCYYWGIGRESDYEDCVMYLRQSSRQGNADAHYYLGLCCQKGRGFKKSCGQALAYYRKAAGNPSGHADAELAIGKLFYYGDQEVPKDLEQAETWFQMSGSKENAEAQLYLGLCNYEGEGTSQDFEQAANNFELAASRDGGNIDAQFMLGQCFERGLGKPRSIANAAMLYKKAASMGSEQAIRKLGSYTFRVKMALFGSK